MGLGSYSEDRLDQLIAGGELEIAMIRLLQMAAIAEKRRRKSHLADGYRSIVDWTAARADVSHQTARDLCWTVTRLEDAPEVAEQLASGEISFDRAQLLARLPAEHRHVHQEFDIAGLRRFVAHHKRLTRRREKKTGNGRLNFGTEELMTSFWGELPGLDARMMEKAVDQKADEIIPGDVRLAVAERRALALAAICQDSLYQSDTGSESAPVDVAVIVDADAAVETSGRPGCRFWPDLDSDRQRSKRSSATGMSTSLASQRCANRSTWVDAPGPSTESCDVMSSIATENAPWKAVPSTIGSRSITSSPGHTAGEPMRTI